MIANRIEFIDGYWHLNAMLHCNMEEYRRTGGGGEEDWEHLEEDGTWELEMLGGYCEDLLRAYIDNGGKVKQVFIKE